MTLPPFDTPLAFLRSRRSVRRFLPDPVPAAVLERVLETAAFAPSAHNRQPWRFAVLTKPEAKEHLVQSMSADFRRDAQADNLPEAEIERRLKRRSQRILGAPAAIVLCMDASEMDVYPDPRRRQAELAMAVQSVALAGGTLLLAAHAEGLGGVWVCAPLFAPEVTRQSLGLPESWQPQGMILLGYPAENPELRPRRPLSEVVRGMELTSGSAADKSENYVK